MAEIHDATDVVDEITNDIFDRIESFTNDERMMILCYLAKHLNAILDTVLAHDYHETLYGRLRRK